MFTVLYFCVCLSLQIGSGFGIDASFEENKALPIVMWHGMGI